MQQRQPMPQPMMQQQSMPQNSLPQNSLLMIQLPQVDMNHFHSLTDPNERKQWVGTLIYPVILKHVGEQLASKITGMVIDETAVNLPAMLQDQIYFNKNINEALNLLSNQAQAQGQPQQQ